MDIITKDNYCKPSVCSSGNGALLKKNFLGEFATNYEKERARKNLGIDFDNVIKSTIKHQDFINVTDKYNIKNISISEAIKYIPPKYRKEGQVVTFIDQEDKWAIYQFKGESVNQWNNYTLWENLYKINFVDSIIPDDEDLELTDPDNDGNSKIKLKDRLFNVEEYSGKGYKILRKNIVEIEDSNTHLVNTLNYLYQDMIDQPSTIYEIRYDFDLSGQNINIPQNSILFFNGGSIDNGTVTMNNCEVIGTMRGTFVPSGEFQYSGLTADEEDITIHTALNNKSYLKLKDRSYNPELASGKGYKILRKNLSLVDGVIVNTLTQEMINEPNTIYEIRYDFDLNGETINIPEGCILKFEGGRIVNGDINGTLGNEYLKPEWFGAKGDGVTNDYQAIKVCIECGNVVILEGNYMIDEFPSIKRIQHDLELIGCNNASIILSSDIDLGNTSANLIQSSIDYYPSLLKCTNLKFIINTTCSSDNESVGLNIFQVNAEKILFDNVKFINNGKYNAFCALYVMDADEITINNCYVYDRSMGKIGGAFLWYIKRDQSSNDCIVKINDSIIDCDGGDEIIALMKRASNVNPIHLRAFINNCTFYGGNTYKKDSQNSFITVVDTRENGDSTFEVNISCCNFYNYANDNVQYRTICATKLAGTGQDSSVLDNKSAIVNMDNCYVQDKTNGILFSPRTKACTFNINCCKIESTNSVLLDNLSYCSIVRHAGVVNINDCDITVLGLYKMSGTTIGNSYITINNSTLNLSNSYLPLCYFYFINTRIYSNTLFLRVRSTQEHHKDLVLNNVYFNNSKVDKFFYKDENMVLSFFITNYTIYGQTAYNVTYLGGKIGELVLRFDRILLNETSNDEFTAYMNGCITEYKNLELPLSQTNKLTLKVLNTSTKELIIDATIYKYYNDFLLPKSSKTTLLPDEVEYLEVGDYYFDTTLNKPIWWTGTKWIDSDGNNADSTPITSGTFANKPTGVDVGYAYFCTDKQTSEGSTNGIMIYYKGDNVWVDALGRVVS